MTTTNIEGLLEQIIAGDQIEQDYECPQHGHRMVELVDGKSAKLARQAKELLPKWVSPSYGSPFQTIIGYNFATKQYAWKTGPTSWLLIGTKDEYIPVDCALLVPGPPTPPGEK